MFSAKWMIVAALAAGVPAMAADATVAGKWKLTSEIMGVERSSDCVLTQDGGKVSGECSHDGESNKLNGTLANGALHLTVNAEFQGTPITVTYDAKVEADKPVSGSVQVDPFGVGGTFTLTKSDAPAAAPAAAPAPASK